MADHSSDFVDDTEHTDKKRKLDACDIEAPSALLSAVSEEDVKKIVKSFDYDALATIMTQICVKNADAMQTLHEHWSRDVNNRKLYIRNLNFDTSNEALHAAFAPFGNIVDAAVIMDKATGKNKGFAFVTFSTADEAQRALASPTLNIGGRLASVALAAAGKSLTAAGPGGTTAANDLATRKLFVRSLSFETTEATLQNFFSQYGELSEIFLFRDKETGKSKGHAFITYIDPAAATRALQDPIKTIDNRKAIAKLAAEGMAESNQRKQQQQILTSANSLAAAMVQHSALLPFGVGLPGMPSGSASLQNIHSAMSAMQFAPGAATAPVSAAPSYGQPSLVPHSSAHHVAAQQQQQQAMAHQHAAHQQALQQHAAQMAAYYAAYGQPPPPPSSSVSR